MAPSNPEDMHRCFVEAFNTADASNVMALYESQATLVPQPGLTADGAGAIRAALAGFLALNGQIQMDTEYCVQAGDLALLRGKWQLAGKSADGRPVELMGNSVEVLRRQPDGRWLFVIDHPFGAV